MLLHFLATTVAVPKPSYACLMEASALLPLAEMQRLLTLAVGLLRSRTWLLVWEFPHGKASARSARRLLLPSMRQRPSFAPLAAPASAAPIGLLAWRARALNSKGRGQSSCTHAFGKTYFVL